jgi:hypothetical protein
MLQPVERRLARERGHVLALGLEPVGEQPQDRIEAQLVVIVEVLVAEREPMDALRQQRSETMHDEVGIALVAKATRNPVCQADRTIRLAQQRSAGIRGDGAAVEATHNLAPLEAFKDQLLRATVCSHRPGLFDQQK